MLGNNKGKFKTVVKKKMCFLRARRVINTMKKLEYNSEKQVPTQHSFNTLERPRKRSSKFILAFANTAILGSIFYRLMALGAFRT
jgi:hypothetical protein